MTISEVRNRFKTIDLHPAQASIVENATRFNVLACGRRYGKTLLGLQRTERPLLDGHPVGWFSPTYKLLAEVWRDALIHYDAIKQSKSEQEHRLELITGGVLEFWSVDDPDPARGRKYKRVILDEAAMVKRLEEAWQEAIRPTLTDLAGDGWFLSTPRGLNYFHQLYQLGADGLNQEWKSWQFPTTANPFIDPAEIEAARLELPERVFAQEYLAQFLSDGVGVFRGIQAACVLKPQPTVIPGHVYVIGVDWGKLADFSVFSVLDTTSMQQVWIDRSNQLDYVFQLDRLKLLCSRYLPRVVSVERNSVGEPLIELLRRAGLPVEAWTASNVSKQDAIEALSLAIEKGELKLLDDPIQMAELLAYDAIRLPGGMLRYSAPTGQHDDTVMALAIAYTQVKTSWLVGLAHQKTNVGYGGGTKQPGWGTPKVGQVG